MWGKKEKDFDFEGQVTHTAPVASVKENRRDFSKVFEIIDKVRKDHDNGKPYPKDSEEDFIGENPGHDIPVSIIIDDQTDEGLEVKKNFFEEHGKELLIIGTIVGLAGIAAIVARGEHFKNIKPFKKRENLQKKEPGK